MQSEELNKRCRDEAATSSSEDEQPPPKLARQNAVSDPVVDEPVEVETESEPMACPAVGLSLTSPPRGKGVTKRSRILESTLGPVLRLISDLELTLGRRLRHSAALVRAAPSLLT